MKTTARISLPILPGLLVLPILLTLPAGCDRATQPEFTVCPPEPQNSVAYLKSLCDGKSSVAVTQDIIIRGFVTANDLYGEFYRTIVVEDASGGIAIAAEGSPLADLYPFGIVATVRCNGLTLCDYGGKNPAGNDTRRRRRGVHPARRAGTVHPHRTARRRDPLRTVPDVRRRLGPAHRHPRPFRRRAFRRRRENLVRHRPGDGPHRRHRARDRRHPGPDLHRADRRDLRLRKGASAPGHRLLVWNHRLFRRKILPARHQPRSGIFRHGNVFRSISPNRRMSGADDAGIYRCNASHSISLSRGMFSPETDEMKTDGTPSGR